MQCCNENIPIGRKLKSLRIGPPGGQNLNMVSGGILDKQIHQNIDSGTINLKHHNIYIYVYIYIYIYILDATQAPKGACSARYTD